MFESSNGRSGRHFLQIPGPSNVPDRVIRAMAQPVIDHRSMQFAEFAKSLLKKIGPVFKTTSPVIIYPGSGTGGWEAALLNTLSPGDRVLAFETGHFATLWKKVGDSLGLDIDWVAGDWRHGVDPAIVEEKLSADRDEKFKAVLAVHTETSTGITSRIAEIRQAIDSVGHPALFMVDTVSSLACSDFRHDEWGVDVTVSGSQKGLMLPPGLCFNAISQKAIDHSKKSGFHHSYWKWEAMLDNNARGFYPYTPGTTLLYGLDEALNMIHEEGLENVFKRHARLAKATRLAVEAWDLENLCLNPDEYSNTTTAVMTPDGHDADKLRQVILERFNMSLGMGLGKLKGQVFRIGHLGDFNELMLAGTLSGVEMGLSISGIPFTGGGVNAALEFLASSD